MSDSHVRIVPEGDPSYVEPAGTIDDAIRTLRRYVRVILTSLALIAALYTATAIAYYLISPATSTTSVPFRLDWEGAEKGKYPNGLKFSPADIVTKPVILEVFGRNEVGRYAKFSDFAQAVFVLESNRVAEKLAAEYQTKLADPKLTPIERDRLENEYRAKREAVAKNEYAINHVATEKTRGIPKTVLTKSLQDILETWAKLAAVERKVTKYPVAVMSPAEVDEDATVADPFVALHMLRTRIRRALDNVGELDHLPGAELAHSGKQRSLHEIRNRLEDLLRFRLEPLIMATPSTDQAAALRFAEAQLAYDERVLKALQDEAGAARESLIAYFDDPSMTRPKTPPQGEGTTPDNVTPQLTDTFLDRLVALTKNPADVAYRQVLVQDMRNTTLAMIPAQAAVDFDRASLERLRSGRTPGDPNLARAEIPRLFADVRSLVVDINSLYVSLSKNLEPASQLYTITSPPYRFRERAVAANRLLLYGILTLLLAFPIIVASCLIYDRVRRDFRDDERDERDEYAASRRTSD
jgi:hypothetical protein